MFAHIHLTVLFPLLCALGWSCSSHTITVCCFRFEGSGFWNDKDKAPLLPEGKGLLFQEVFDLYWCPSIGFHYSRLPLFGQADDTCNSKGRA